MTYILLVDGDNCRSGTNGLGGCVSAGVRETLTAVVAILLSETAVSNLQLIMRYNFLCEMQADVHFL